MNTRRQILILHGPNMNLIGLKSAQGGRRITLDKINRSLRIKARQLNLDLKILQSNEEGKAVTFLQSNGKTASGILIFPGPWQVGGFALQDTLALLTIPFITVSSREEAGLLLGFENIIGVDFIAAGEKGLQFLADQVD